MRRRVLEIQVFRQGLVFQGQNDLDDTRDARGRFQVPDVGLRRADQERPAGLASGPVHRTRGLGLDRVAQRCSGAVCFQVSDVAGIENGAAQRIGDYSLLCHTVGHRQATRSTVLIDRAAANHGPDPVAVVDGVFEPFDDDDTAALATHVAVRGGVERLAPAVGRKHLRVGERDHGCRCQQDVRTAGQCEIAFAQLQRLARLMNCHQRRAARRVHGDCGPLKPQPVTDPSRRCGVRRPDGHVGLDLGVSQPGGRHPQVVVGSQTHEHAGVGAGQSRRRGAGMLYRAPGRLQQESVLRVQHPDLARRHPEERRVEPGHVIDETGPTGHDLAGCAGLGVEERIDIPAAAGHVRYRFAALAQQLPERLRIRSPGKTCGVADDCESLWLVRNLE